MLTATTKAAVAAANDSRDTLDPWDDANARQLMTKQSRQEDVICYAIHPSMQQRLIQHLAGFRGPRDLEDPSSPERSCQALHRKNQTGAQLGGFSVCGCRIGFRTRSVLVFLELNGGIFKDSKELKRMFC